MEIILQNLLLSVMVGMQQATLSGSDISRLEQRHSQQKQQV